MPGAETGERAERVLVVEWPDWPLVAAGVEAGIPAVVVGANRVIAASPSARLDGVRVGQRRREAQRASPSVVVVAHDPERDMRVFDPIARALVDVTARLEVERAGRCLFATRGPARYHGGDSALAERTVEVVLASAPNGAEAVAGPPTIGIADGSFAARLAARLAGERGQRHLVVPPGASAAFLAAFPVSALIDGGQGTSRPSFARDSSASNRRRIDAEGERRQSGGPKGTGIDDLVGLFVRLGIRSLEQLAELHAVDIVARFGPLGCDAHRLARGLDRRPLLGREPPPDLTVEHHFDEPVVTSGPVAFAGKQLADDLLERLRANGMACTQVLVVAETDHGERSERLWRHEPAFTAAAMAERVRWQLDLGAGRGDYDVPTAGITSLRLEPTEVVAATGEQRGFWGGRTLADDRAQRAVARLVGVLGPHAVCRPEVRGGRSLGDAVILVPTVSSETANRRSEPVVARTGTGTPPWPGQVPDPAPATVWPEPLIIELLDARGRSVRVSGRGLLSAPPEQVVIGGRSHAVTAWSTPWPVDERWWDPERARRCARLQIVTESGAAFLVVVEKGHWAMHATYD